MNPDQPESSSNQIGFSTSVSVASWGGGSGFSTGNGSATSEEQRIYALQEAAKAGTESITTGSKFVNGAGSPTFKVTLAYGNNSGMSEGANVLSVDVGKQQSNKRKTFWGGVYSLKIGLNRFGNYLAEVSGFRDWQSGSVVDRSYYQDKAIRESKYTYELGKYIFSDIDRTLLFFNSAFNHASNNQVYVAGRFMTGGYKWSCW